MVSVYLLGSNKSFGPNIDEYLFRSDTCTCGIGQQFRTIFCERAHPNNERCDLRQTPNTYRECEINSDCMGEWFIGIYYIFCFQTLNSNLYKN